jgi:hypothetical protein
MSLENYVDTNTFQSLLKKVRKGIKLGERDLYGLIQRDNSQILQKDPDPDGTVLYSFVSDGTETKTLVDTDNRIIYATQSSRILVPDIGEVSIVDIYQARKGRKHPFRVYKSVSVPLNTQLSPFSEIAVEHEVNNKGKMQNSVTCTLTPAIAEALLVGTTVDIQNTEDQKLTYKADSNEFYFCYNLWTESSWEAVKICVTLDQLAQLGIAENLPTIKTNTYSQATANTRFAVGSNIVEVTMPAANPDIKEAILSGENHMLKAQIKIANIPQ